MAESAVIDNRVASVPMQSWVARFGDQGKSRFGSLRLVNQKPTDEAMRIA